MEVGGTLLSYGCSTHRAESVIREVAALEGHEAHAFAVPTGLFVSLRDKTGGEPFVRLVRVDEWAVDLDRLAEVDRIFNEVLDHKLTLEGAQKQLHALHDRPPAYPGWLRMGAYAGGAAAASTFFGARWSETAVAGVGGLLLGLLGSALAKSPRTRLVGDFLGAMVAAALAWIATAVNPRLSRETLVISIVILLLPGMSMTTGLAELAHKNLVSGAAKLMEAMIVFLSIVFGIAIFVGIEQVFHGHAGPGPTRHVTASYVYLAGVFVAALSFSIMFSVPRRYLLLGVLSGAIGWLVSTLLHERSSSMAAFFAALSVCLYANGCARVLQRPSQVFLLPGLIMLVPGSFGFLSLESFLRGEFLGGASKGFEMFLIAAGIVTGLLVANVVLPARKLL